MNGVGDQKHPQDKEMEKSKLVVWEGPKNSWEKREVRGKGEKKMYTHETYTHLNAEFQRVVRRDKAFLSNQCKEKEENNKMGETIDFFKKIRDTKGIFHAKWAQ